MKQIKFVVVIAVLLAMVLGAAGCGAQSEKPAGPVSIRVLAMQQAGPTPEEMNAIVAKFNEQNPNIKVEIEYVSYDALHDKIVTAMATNPPAYDATLVDDIWYAEFAKNGYIWDVTSKLDDNMKKNIFESAWAITTVNGKTYGMPWLLDAKYFYYNEKILADAGIAAPPATWEELVDQSKVIKEKGLVEYPIAWSWGQVEAVICDYVTLLEGEGSGLVDAEGKPVFNQGAGVKALEWMKMTIDEGISNPSSISYVEEDVRNVFSQGKAAFALNWLYMYDLAALNEQESTVVGQVKMSLVPAFKDSGVKSATINGSMGFSVVDKSPNKEAAWEFVKFLTSEAIQKEYAAHLLPVWQNNYEGDALAALEALNPSTPVTVPMFKDQIPFSKVRPKVPYYPEGSKALQLAIQEALTGQKSAQQALDDAAKIWVDLGNK